LRWRRHLPAPVKQLGSRAIQVKQIRDLGVPLNLALFFHRAERRAKPDAEELMMMTHEWDFATIIKLAAGRRRCVEIGTGIATTTIGLALADSGRIVWSYDPYPRDWSRYVSLVPENARRRINFIAERGDAPSHPPSDVDFLFIDSSHEREDVVTEFQTWLPHLAEDGLVAFHDYDDPNWPGVMAAIDDDLKLQGEARGYVFVWRKPVSSCAGAGDK
jgi:predicted O-methyltransferase YrrM